MPPEALIQSLGEQLTATGGAQAAFGEPVTQGDRTVIPVSRVASFFGGGSGGLAAAEGRSPARGGGGGGGAVAAWPIGVIEVSPEGTRFVPIADPRRSLAAVGIGFAIGWFLGRRAGRRGR
ncbi:MAG TPA: spore germination protein GerW family protein [Thermoanaerobaculia bacterium]|nr:spore germination protein GerW family protein [Thermoanaerobaculia bacterium]